MQSDNRNYKSEEQGLDNDKVLHSQVFSLTGMIEEVICYAEAKHPDKELDIEIEGLKYFCSSPNIYEYKGLNYHILDLFFCCSVMDFSQIKTTDEVSDYFFKNIDELEMDKIGFPSTRKALELYAKNHAG